MNIDFTERLEKLLDIHFYNLFSRTNSKKLT